MGRFCKSLSVIACQLDRKMAILVFSFFDFDQTSREGFSVCHSIVPLKPFDKIFLDPKGQKKD